VVVAPSTGNTPSPDPVIRATVVLRSTSSPLTASAMDPLTTSPVTRDHVVTSPVDITSTISPLIAEPVRLTASSYLKTGSIVRAPLRTSQYIHAIPIINTSTYLNFIMIMIIG
jgi:hypothetical protein